MTRRVVIADAGPLIALARIEALDLLRQLVGRVCITTTVRDEILPAKAVFADTHLLVSTLAEGWIDVVEVPTSDFRPWSCAHWLGGDDWPGEDRRPGPSSPPVVGALGGFRLFHWAICRLCGIGRCR